MSEWSVQFVNDHFKTLVSKDFFYAMCGECLSNGVSRVVFAYLPDPTCVVKIEHRPKSFQNVMEWDLWQQHKVAGTNVTKWLAPCVSISETGQVLIQKRTKPVPLTWKLPEFVPNVLSSDMKRENWGIFNKRLVCHDYGRHEVIFYASKGRRTGNMDRANWLGAENGHFTLNFGETGATDLVI